MNGDSKKIPTINDVAEKSGVSKRTVSRVINKSDKVNERTRIKVEEVIRRKMYWGVFNHAMKLVAKYEFNQRKAAEKRWFYVIGTFQGRNCAASMREGTAEATE